MLRLANMKPTAMRSLTLVLVLLAKAPGTGVLPPEASPDRVDRKKGAPVAGVEVVSEDYKSVVVKTRGPGAEKTIRIPASEVLDVQRDDEPEAYRQGRDSLSAGDLVNAISALRLAQSQAGGKAWVKEYASFYLGEAYRLSGQAREAAQAYQQVLAVKADSRFLALVRLGMARAYTEAGSYGDAEKVLNDFIGEVDSKRLPVSYKIEANLILGRNLEAQGRHAEAASRYGSVANEARRLAGTAETEEQREDLAVLALRAEADRGAAMIAAKDYVAAETLFGSMSRSHRDDPRAQALADIGMGAVALGKGELDLARVRLTAAATLHFKADEERPRALLLLARTYSELDKKGEKGARRLARAYLNDLLKFYPASDYAGEARELLGTLQ
jgi:TolA-binding protein